MSKNPNDSAEQNLAMLDFLVTNAIDEGFVDLDDLRRLPAHDWRRCPKPSPPTTKPDFSHERQADMAKQKTKAIPKPKTLPGDFDEALAMVLVQSVVDAIETLTSHVDDLTTAIRELRQANQED